jgi:hypothetical protein
MTAEEKPYAVRLAEVARFDAYQVRKGGTDPATVERYKAILRNNIPFRDPIRVAFIKANKGVPKGAAKKRLATGTLVLLDGFHRVEAALAVGAEELPAIVIEATEEEAKWIAALANTCNGRPLKAKEYRAVLDRYVQFHRYGDWSGKSYRTIAQDIGGVAHFCTVRNWMRSDHPAVFRILQQQGQDIEAPGGLPEEGRRPSLAAEAIEEAHRVLQGTTNALPHMTPEERGDLAIVAATLVLDCKEHGTDLHSIPGLSLEGDA